MIQLDASWNGYQHLSLLTTHVENMHRFNFKENVTYSDNPDDYYQYFLNLTIIEINGIFNGTINYTEPNIQSKEMSNSNLEAINRLSNIKFNRSIIKKAFRTKSYNASSIAM